jgi:hypothetical protein
MRLFRSATCPSILQAHGSFSFFVLPALAVGPPGELADRYPTRRQTSAGWPSIESVILNTPFRPPIPCHPGSKTHTRGPPAGRSAGRAPRDGGNAPHSRWLKQRKSVWSQSVQDRHHRYKEGRPDQGEVLLPIHRRQAQQGRALQAQWSVPPSDRPAGSNLDYQRHRRHGHALPRERPEQGRSVSHWRRQRQGHADRQQGQRLDHQYGWFGINPRNNVVRF